MSWRFFVSTLFGLTLSRLAFAQDTQRAEALFNQGNSLVSRGEYTQACPLFEESDKLDPAIGTQFNLADCYAHTKRDKLAFRLATQVLTTAHAAGKQLVENNAKRLITELRTRLAELKVELAESPPGLEVHIDGERVPAAELSSPLYLEKSQHTITATAPGRASFSAEFDLTGGDTNFVIPALTSATTTDRVAPQPIDRLVVPNPSPLKTIGLVVGGIGLVGMGVGGYFGASVLSKCSGGKCDDGQPARVIDPARGQANLSTAFLIGGSALLVTGVVLYVVAPKNEALRAFLRPATLSF